MSARRLHRLVILTAAVALGAAAAGRAESARSLVKRGNTAYAAGRYDEAMKAYEQADVESPESPVVAFNQGTVHYRTEDYAAARESFAEAARRSRDPVFEAGCRYNTGNCWFKEARRQMDSDLKKAVEACESSVDSYQAALALHPEFEDAKRNIEVVRRLWKSILDEQKRRQEQQQAQQEQQQKLAEQLRQLIERQEKAARESADLAKGQEAQNANQAVREQSSAQADVQRQLGQDTQATADSLQQMLSQSQAPAPANPGGTPPPPQAPGHPALEHMAQARERQDQAAQKLDQCQPKPASGDQSQAAEALRQALDSLSQTQQEQQDQQGKQNQPQQQNPQGRQQQPGEKGKEQEQGREQEKPPQEQEKGPGQEAKQPPQEQEKQEQAATVKEGKEEGEPKEQPQARTRLVDQDARDILDAEKRNRDRRTAAEQDGIQPVDKDW